MNKIMFFVLISVFFAMDLFSFSRKSETLFIANYSSKPITIFYEFWNGESQEKTNYIWEQNIHENILVIKDELFNKQGFSVLSMKIRYFLSYYPAVSILESSDYYKKMATIPFMDKMRAIYKLFVIKDEKGNVLLSLDELNDYIIKRNIIGGVSYFYIEIFDYNLVGKPAGEW